MEPVSPERWPGVSRMPTPLRRQRRPTPCCGDRQNALLRVRLFRLQTLACKKNRKGAGYARHIGRVCSKVG